MIKTKTKSGWKWSKLLRYMSEHLSQSNQFLGHPALLSIIINAIFCFLLHKYLKSLCVGHWVSSYSIYWLLSVNKPAKILSLSLLRLQSFMWQFNLYQCDSVTGHCSSGEDHGLINNWSHHIPYKIVSNFLSLPGHNCKLKFWLEIYIFSRISRVIWRMGLLSTSQSQLGTNISDQ